MTRSNRQWPILSIIVTMVPLFVGNSTCTSEAPLLFTAIISGDLQEAQAALQSGEDPNALYRSDDAHRGQTPLIMAISTDNTAIANLLLNQPTINVNAQSTHDGTTALIEAAKGAHGALVTRLLNAGANPNTVDHTGRSARNYGIEN